MSIFEATRGLFWNEPRNFEPQTDDVDDTCAATPIPNFRTTSAGGSGSPKYDLKCNRPNTRPIFSGIGFRTWNPPVPKPKPYHQATVAFL
ncbi:hypothetical protein AVEN_37495-1 [Araneus ventricosus]|uniref:Uncharacterized protein n=1 Tax=Araneus ventricosus TaxID=182803 RepID=A0A4Y2J8F0_ARAVE|nr:hypothetical protein AVEN_37495-1 [Araneus ventricosus]